MRAFVIVAGLAAAVCASLAIPPSAAQTKSSWHAKYDACARQARAQKLDGQDLVDAIGECLNRAAAGTGVTRPTAWQDKYQDCADEGHYGKHAGGQALVDYVWRCENARGSGSSAPASGQSWHEKRQACDDDGRHGKGLTGNMLRNYVDRCLAQQP
jgi:hypothetical protein